MFQQQAPCTLGFKAGSNIADSQSWREQHGLEIEEEGFFWFAQPGLWLVTQHTLVFVCPNLSVIHTASIKDVHLSTGTFIQHFELFALCVCVCKIFVLDRTPINKY